ncbi:tetratricopeptide repeat protein [Streptomyces sp. NPDC096153]|uniref:tetratricopeptide repeat protein n=1 Tax=Streptomyces sp. NPDC096153 TaxID=3155548 RepID=UPI003327DC41
MAVHAEQSVPGLLSRALTALEARDVEAARTLAAQAEELSTGPLALANAALVHGYVDEHAGEMECAVQRFEHATTLAAGCCDVPEGLSLYVHATVATATAHRMRGQYAVAERLLVTALSRVEEQATAEDVVAVYNELGVLFKYSGKFEAAADFYERALGRLSGNGGPELATLHHNIAGLAHARGDYAAAEEPARKAVAIRTEALGPEHPDVAADYAALAPILLEIGEAEEAESLLRKALRIFDNAYGADHYEVGIAAGNLAAVIHQAGRREEAMAHYERSLAVLERALGPEHPELAPVLNNYAQLIRMTDPCRAREALERARLSLFAASVGENHPTLTAVNVCLSELENPK